MSETRRSGRRVGAMSIMQEIEDLLIPIGLLIAWSGPLVPVLIWRAVQQKLPSSSKSSSDHFNQKPGHSSLPAT